MDTGICKRIELEVRKSCDLARLVGLHLEGRVTPRRDGMLYAIRVKELRINKEYITAYCVSPEVHEQTEEHIASDIELRMKDIVEHIAWVKESRI